MASSTSPNRSAVLHRDIHSAPKKAVGGKGNYVFLDDGQKIFDATGGAAVSCLGHANPAVKAAISQQMDQLSYCHSAFFSTPGFEELADFLVDSTGGKMSKAYIVSSGSEAMEVAMKLTRQYFLEMETPQPERIRFIARNESYHGTTLGALSVGGHKARRELYEPILLPNVSHVSACHPYRWKRDGETDAEYVERLAQELDDEFRRVGPETVCAFVAEPIVGAAMGCVPEVPGYFQAMKRVCDKYGALLIFDEVMSGMGRSGTLHAWEQVGVAPDLQTIGKGLGGGYAPVSGLLIGQKVVDVLDRGTGVFKNGHTYQGHPISCAAALAVQKAIKERNLLENIRNMGALLESLLKSRLSQHPNVGNIRGMGLFWGIEFVKDKSTKEPFDPKLGVGALVQDLALSPKYSISLYAGAGTVDGKRGDHILIAPAYNTTKEDIEMIADLTTRVIEEAFSTL
ncbi:hypothetical protein FQN54_001320 [Arachnomyces sp. PD_36]|nr:hypothetical protein FQN54_001320 [Arachnomyces sp. PD_36]